MALNSLPTVVCDVLFLEASVPNLLVALSLIDRFDGTHLKILETTPRPLCSNASLMAVSPDAWRKLTELVPTVAATVYRRGLFANEQTDLLDESHRLRDTQMISARSFYELLLNALPSTILTSTPALKQIHETSDLVTLEMQNGDHYETKLLIQGGSHEGPHSDFTEVICTVNNCHSSITTKWTSEEMYISYDRVGAGLHVFGCVMPHWVASLDALLSRFKSIRELDEVIASSHLESFWSRPLYHNPLAVSHGRIGSSGELSAGIPYFARFKAETELEEALLLKEAILQKGLTAAAISDWKRRYTASTRTQFLKDLRSPVELFSISDDSLNNGHHYQASEASSSLVHVENAELGKPLICRNVRPYMALSLVD